MEQHEGALRVESAEGEGTAVIVTLPGGDACLSADDEPLRKEVG